MSKALLGAYQGLGLSTVAKETSPEREAERATARAKKAQMDQELEKTLATRPSESDYATMREGQSIALENALEAQKQQRRQDNKRRSFDAFERYDNDNFDVRHLNTMFGDLERNGSTMYGDIARVDKVTEADRELLERSESRITQQMLDDPEVSASFVVATLRDGTKELRSLDQLKGVTGYNDYASAKELQRQQTTLEIGMLSSIGYDSSPRGREAYRRTVAELPPGTDPKSKEFQDTYTKHYDQHAELEKSTRGRGYENETENEKLARRMLAQDGIFPGDPRFETAMADKMLELDSIKGRPSKVRGQEFANEARTALDDMNFFDMDIGNLSVGERAKIEPHVSMIEQAAGAELSTADKATLQRINKLTMLGGEAGELTAEQTGLIDNIFRQVKKYISDNTTGVQAEAAYAAYQNTVRHALFGSVLTPGETKSFVQQFGSMGQQRGPILAQLRSSLSEVKSDYETLMATNDPYVIHYRTGKTAEDLSDIIYAIDDRIDLIDRTMRGETIQMAEPGNTPTQDAVNKLSGDSGVTLTEEQRNQMRAIKEGAS